MKANLIFLFLTIAFILPAQKMRPGGKDAIHAKRVAFITKKVDLTSQEAEKFWPVFNDYEHKREDIRRERIKGKKSFEANENQAEKDLEVLIDNEVASHQKEADLLKERHKQLKKVLSIKKIALLYKAEEDFKKVLIREACERLSAGKNSDED